MFIDADNIISCDTTNMPSKDRTAYYVNLNTNNFENSRLIFCSGFGNNAFAVSQNIISKLEVLFQQRDADPPA